MKKLICLVLSLLLLLTGCRSAGSAADTGATQPVGSEVSTTPSTEPSETTENTQPTDESTVALPGNDAVTMGQTGKLRIAYTGNRSGVRYVTDPSQLPDYPELAGYDEAFFREHGLLLVTETVTSGSVGVDILSIVVENGMAVVTLDHQIPSGLGTADMATWLMWVEVDAGLDLTWVLANPALKPDNQQNERY